MLFIITIFLEKIDFRLLFLNKFTHVLYSIGLGDTNYTNFCNCSKSLNSRLLDLGATYFYPPGFADDAVG